MIEKQLSYKYKVYKQLKEDIITGKYSEGEVLNERKLADAMGISRTPIREALSILNTEGWIIDEPYKGAVVRPFTVEYVMQAHKVRRALEVLAVEDAINNIKSENINELKDILEKQAKNLKNYDPAEFMTLDREFHDLIYSLSKNDILQDLLKNLHDMIRYFGIKVLSYPERSRTTLSEHIAIFEGINQKNIEVAKEAMDYHMLKTREEILKRTKNKYD